MDQGPDSSGGNTRLQNIAWEVIYYSPLKILSHECRRCLWLWDAGPFRRCSFYHPLRSPCLRYALTDSELTVRILSFVLGRSLLVGRHRETVLVLLRPIDLQLMMKQLGPLEGDFDVRHLRSPGGGVFQHGMVETDPC
jgi:hypothetical protein